MKVIVSTVSNRTKVNGEVTRYEEQIALSAYPGINTITPEQLEAFGRMLKALGVEAITKLEVEDE